MGKGNSFHFPALTAYPGPGGKKKEKRKKEKETTKTVFSGARLDIKVLICTSPSAVELKGSIPPIQQARQASGKMASLVPAA